MRLINALAYMGLLLRHRLLTAFSGPTFGTTPRASPSERWRHRRVVEMLACALVAFLVLTDAAVLKGPAAILISSVAVLSAITAWRYWRLSREIREAREFEDLFWG